MIAPTSSSAGARLFHSWTTDRKEAVAETLEPLDLSWTNVEYALMAGRGGGDNAAFFKFLSAAVSFLACAATFCSSVNAFLGTFLATFFFTGFFAATVFFFVAGFFAAAVFFFARTCFVAASSVVVDLAARLTARLTGREGSPTAFRGLPGVA